jgi:integrase
MRARRDEAKALLAQGIDPSQKRKLDKLSRAASMATTFGGIAEEYLEKQRRDGRSERTLEKGRWLLALARPALWDRPITDIRAPEILAVLKKLETKGHLESAKRVRGICGSVIRYAIVTARAENDPTQGLRGAISMPKPEHRAAILDPVALGGFLRALDGFDGQPVTRAALQLLPLVFTRPGELRLAEWQEFDLKAATWTIPASRTKMRREHKVPLAPQAVLILRDLHTLTGGGLQVFPSLRSPLRPLSENTLNACYRRLGYGKDEVTLFITTHSLSSQLMEARDEKRLMKLQAQLQNVKLLIIDELGYVPLSQIGAELLFEVFSQRYERGSTMGHPTCHLKNGHRYSSPSATLVPCWIGSPTMSTCLN